MSKIKVGKTYTWTSEDVNFFGDGIDRRGQEVVVVKILDYGFCRVQYTDPEMVASILRFNTDGTFLAYPKELHAD